MMSLFSLLSRRNHLLTMLLPAAVGLSLAASALPAHAQSVTLNYAGQVVSGTTTNRTYTFADNQAYINLTTSYNGVQSSLSNANIYAGSFTLTATPALAGVANPFTGYCIQLGTPITNGQTAAVQTLNSSFNLGKASTTSANFGGAIAYLYNTNSPTIAALGQSNAAADQSAALQLAIWEVEYNWTGTGLGGIDTSLSTGNFTYLGDASGGSTDTTTTAIRGYAAGFLNAWAGKTSTATWLNSYNTTTPSASQQSVVTTFTTSASSAPEPSALALLVGPLGIAGAGMVRRRRRAA